MSSRMSKYYEEPENLVTRTSRNEELYKDISKSELENYSIKSNATVLGDNEPDIDVDKIKKILDTRYNEIPRRQSIKIEEEPEEIVEREDTKEYDINAIIEKAREEKVESYDEERLKKLRDTQFDILTNINVKEPKIEDEEKPELQKEKDNLANLINTIAFNETNANTDPLDILSDLKGDDDTKLLGVEDKTDENEIVEDENSRTFEEIANTFYTQSNSIQNKDFNDDEFKDIEEGTNIFIKIIIAVVILAFVAGVAILLKSIFF